MKILKCTLLLAVPFLFTNCEKAEMKGDVSFAKNTFEALARGDTPVESKIDWETLNSLGANVGAQYIALRTDEEKREFRNGYVTQFSANFRDSGGSVENFTNWRVVSHDDTRTEVAADSSNGLLRLTVSERDSMERLSSIQISP